MCNPLVIAAVPYIMAAAAAAGTAMAMKQSNDGIQAQMDAAGKAAKFDYDQLSQRKNQVDEQAAHEILQRKLQTSREHGMVMVAQGEAGVGGNSAMRVLGNTLFQGAADEGRIAANADNQRDGISAQTMAIGMGLEGQNNTLASQGQGGVGAGLSIGTSAASGYSSGVSVAGAFGPKKIPEKKHTPGAWG